MSLSVALLEAIKNKAYRLKPVEKTNSNLTTLPKDDLGLGEILARRMAMGYGQEDSLEEEERSFISYKFVYFMPPSQLILQFLGLMEQFIYETRLLKLFEQF